MLIFIVIDSMVIRIFFFQIQRIVDMRSDTVTQPSREMKEAMFDAPVGDDVFSEDSTVKGIFLNHLKITFNFKRFMDFS